MNLSLGLSLKTLLISAIIALLIALNLQSLFNESFFGMHDFTHVARLAEMDRALRDGHFPVRWSKNFGYGYGMPLFNFYGPLPFYTAEIAYVLGFSAIASIKFMMIAIAAIGVVGTYVLSTKWFGRSGGLLAASLFLFIPYRALDLFVRGALNELFSISMIPWILYGLVQLHESKKISWKWIGLTSVAFFGLFTSHILMVMVFVPFLVLLAFLWGAAARSKLSFFLSFLLSFLLGIGLSAFYIVPAFFEKGFTQVDKLVGGYSAYYYHFLYVRQFFIGAWGYGGSILGLEDGVSFRLGAVHVILAVLGGIALVRSKLRWKWKILIPFGIIGALSLFLTTFKSKILWDTLPLIEYIQFPWRYLSVPAVILPLVGGASVGIVKQGFKRTLFTIIAVIAVILLNISLFRPEKFLEDSSVLYYTDEQKIQTKLSEILPDYIPKSMRELQASGKQVIEIEQGSLHQDTENSNFEVLVDRTHELLFSMNVSSPVTILVRKSWFPVWKVYDNGKEIEYQVDETSGFLRFSIGTGKHLIGVRLAESPVRVVSNVVSIISLLALGVLLYGRSSRS